MNMNMKEVWKKINNIGINISINMEEKQRKIARKTVIKILNNKNQP